MLALADLARGGAGTISNRERCCGWGPCSFNAREADCFKGQKMARCSECRAVSYCKGTYCAMTGWLGPHGAFCKLIVKVREENKAAKARANA